MKKFVSFFTAACMLCSVALASDVRVYRTRDGISVSGKLDRAADSDITLGIVAADADKNNLAPEDFVFADQKHSADGSFLFSKDAEIAPGDYVVRLGANGETIEATLHISSKEDLASAIGKLNSATTDTMASVLSSEISGVTVAKHLNLDLSLLDALSSKANVYAELVRNAPYSEEQPQQPAEILSKAVLTEQINGADDVNTLKMLVSQAEALYQMVSADEKIKKLFDSAADQELTYTKLKGLSITCSDLLNQYFGQAVVLAGIQNPKNGRLDIPVLLRDGQKAVGIQDGDISSYNGLSSNQKLYVDQQLLGKSFATPESLVAALKSALASVPSDNGGGGGNGGSTGNNGNGSNISLPSVTPTPLPTLPPEDDMKFQDLGGVSWAAEAIRELHKLGIVNGKTETTYDPNGNVTREEFIKMLILAFTLTDQSAQTSFSDVEAGAWYYPYVATAEKLGITSGMGDGSFGVGANITREDMAVFLYKTALLKGISLEGDKSFADASEISDYALESVSRLAAEGIINGVGENLFAPNANATRAESAKMIYGILQR